MTLDSTTLIFVLVSTSGLMALMFLVAFWRENVPEARLCTAMLLTQMVTWALYGARGSWPDQVWIVVVGNSAMTLGWGFATDAACRFQQIKVPPYSHYWPVPIIAAGSWLLFDNLAARLLYYVLVSCVQMGLVLAVVIVRRRKYPTLIGDFIAVAIVLLAASILVRSLYGWFHPDIAPLKPGNSSPQNAVLITSFVAILTLSFGFLMLLRDRVEQEIRYLASHDGLTGTLNRSAFMALAEVELARCLRNKRPLALMMIDLDNFKQINDTHGHLVGDEVLRTVTQVTQGSLRKHDAFGRYGGEEFMVLVPETDPGSAAALAERIRNTLRATAFAPAGVAINPPTVSIGIAFLSPGTQSLDLDTFIARADIALYKAKHAGRDRVVHAEED